MNRPLACHDTSTSFHSKCSTEVLLLTDCTSLYASLCRFIPRHADELELDVDDPLYVEEEEDDYWYRGYNMRTGERGIFPAFYAHEVIGQSKELLGERRGEAITSWNFYVLLRK